MTSKKANKRPTIYDLAKLAGVSPGTVSRVLNNKDKVKDQTRERVLRAAQELGLKPQASIRQRQVALVSEPSGTIRLNGYTGILHSHIAFALSGLNIGILVPQNPEEDLKNYFLDGIIAIAFTDKLRNILRSLEERTPVVYLDQYRPDRGQYRVRSDHYQSGRLAAEHFIAKGKKRLAFMSGNYPAGQERAKGFTDAIVEAGLDLGDCKICLAESPVEYATTVTRIVKAKADSLYVPGASLEVVRALHVLQYVLGLKIPDDISVIGGENIGVTEFLNPPITTIEAPLKEIAEKSVEMIHDLMDGKPLEKRTIDFPVRLIERESVL